jgi:serine/threonine protein phosphatase PrpC
MADLLIPVPECKSITITPDHEFLLIASDGLWDVFTSAEACLRAKTGTHICVYICVYIIHGYIYTYVGLLEG